MTESMLGDIHAIEHRSFPDPWPLRFFREELAKVDLAHARVALKDGRVVGYLIAWFILDEVHLGNLAVHPDCRRQGIGRALLEELITRAERHGSSFITLEVRAGNRAAMSLYARYLFRPAGVRKGYYAGREDAVIMLREFGSEGGASAPVPPAGEDSLP